MFSQYKDLQRQLRRNMPAPERVLWYELRNNSFGIKFRRQYALNFFFYTQQITKIFDFYAPALRFRIELDGESHFSTKELQTKEQSEDTYLFNHYNIYTLRFVNPEVMSNKEGVLIRIAECIKQRQTNPSP